MLITVAKIPSRELPLLLTLTYPREWPEDPRRWKRDLDAFGKALRREYPSAAMVWKLEPQKRGAPHFHGLLYGVDFIRIPWLRETWFRVVGGTQAEHLLAGTRIERARNKHCAVAYAAKAYAAKDIVLPPSWKNVGRFWGIINRAALPKSDVVTVRLTAERHYRMRRVMRRWGERHACSVPMEGGFNLISQEQTLWWDVVGHAAAGRFDPPADTR